MAGERKRGASVNSGNWRTKRWGRCGEGGTGGGGRKEGGGRDHPDWHTQNYNKKKKKKKKKFDIAMECHQNTEGRKQRPGIAVTRKKEFIYTRIIRGGFYSTKVPLANVKGNFTTPNTYTKHAAWMRKENCAKKKGDSVAQGGTAQVYIKRWITWPHTQNRDDSRKKKTARRRRWFGVQN